MLRALKLQDLVSVIKSPQLLNLKETVFLEVPNKTPYYKQTNKKFKLQITFQPRPSNLESQVSAFREMF